MKNRSRKKQSDASAARQFLLSAELALDETDRARRIARAAAYLAATRDEFVAHIEKAKQYFAVQPEGGVLAGKAKRYAEN